MPGIDEITASIKKNGNELVNLSRSLHQNPELGGEEFFAMNTICAFLEERGFADIQKGIGDLETAFIASRRIGDGGGLRIGFCAEYDALPEIGHACGHNLIAGAGVAAAIALGESGAAQPFEVVLIGTPDEEVKGGKVDLVKLGAFDDLDAVMMFHSGYGTTIHTRSLACKSWEFIFRGRNAHAASEPTEGRNALDGVILTFTNINALRQYLRDDVRIHGIIKDGGKASNVIPDRAVAEICVRSIDNKYLREVEKRVMDCAKGAALASGTEVEAKLFGNPYDAMVSNRVMEELFSESLDDIGFIDVSKHEEGLGSIDMGNVSRVVPAIHPVLSITDQIVLGHTEEYASLCNTDKAYEVMLAAGQAMALTGYKIISTPGIMEKIRAEFRKSR